MRFRSEPYDLTILLTLKNREVYTKNWLENNIFPEFSYLIADGGDSDLNQAICMKYVSDNVSYVRYPPDLTYRIYLQKRMAAMARISTRYVLSVDNDDFLLREGLIKIMTEFENSPDISLIQGSVGGLKINKHGLYERVADWSHFHGENGGSLDGLKNCLSNYYSLWYSVSEVDIQKKILDIIYSSGTASAYLTEEFQTYLSLALSRSKSVSWYYYARLFNSVGSNDSVSSARHRFDQILDIDYYNSFSYLVRELGKYYDEIDEKTLYELLRGYQISKFIHKPLRLGAHFKTSLNRKLGEWIPSLRVSKHVSAHNVPSLFP